MAEKIARALWYSDRHPVDWTFGNWMALAVPIIGKLLAEGRTKGD